MYSPKKSDIDKTNTYLEDDPEFIGLSAEEMARELKQLAAQVKNGKKFDSLEFIKCGFPDESITDLVSIILNNQSLSTVNFSDTTKFFSNEKLALLVDAITKNRNLTSFTLYSYHEKGVEKNEQLVEIAKDINRAAYRNSLLNALDKHNNTSIDLSKLPIFEYPYINILEKLKTKIHIQEINLSDCGIKDENLPEIINYLEFNENIAEINLSYNKLTDASIDSLLNFISKDDHVACFKLCSYINTPMFSEESIKRLTAMLHDATDNIVQVIIENDMENGKFKQYQKQLDNDFSEKKYLAEVVEELETLDEADNIGIGWEKQSISIHGLQQLLAQISKHINITSLKLISCSLAKEHMEILAVFLAKNNSLESLDLSENFLTTSSNNIRQDLSPILSQGLEQNSSLISLNLSKIELDDTALATLCDSINKSKAPISFLYLSFNKFSFDGAAHLATLIKTKKTLVEISLASNKISGQALITLADALNANNTLTAIDLSLTLATEEEAKAFVEKITTAPIGKTNSSKKSMAEKGSNYSITSLSISSMSKCNLDSGYGKFNYQPSKLEPYTGKSKLTEWLNRYLNENKKNASALIIATQNGNVKAFDDALKKASIYTQRDDGEYLLHIAVKFSHLVIAKKLILLGINTKLRNKQGLTALDIAIEENKVEFMQLLSQNKAVVPPVILSPTKPATKATIAQSKKAKTSPNDNSNTPPSKKQKTITTTPQPGANNNNNDNLVVSTITKSIQPTDDSIGLTDHNLSPKIAFITSPGYGKYFDLIANGNLYQLKKIAADNLTSCHNEEGETALHIAIQTGKLECAQFLLDNGADINAQDSMGFTPLYRLIDNFTNTTNQVDTINQLKLAYLLIRKGALVHSEIHAHALHRAVNMGNYRLMKIILDSPNCDPNAIDSTGMTTLQIAIRRQDLQMVERLLIDRRLTDKTISSALQFAHQTKGQNSKEIYALIEKRQTEKIPQPGSGIQWVNKFSIIYGANQTKRQKPLTIKSDKEHAELMIKNTFTKDRLLNMNTSREDEIKKGNPVTASLTFIFATKAYLATHAKLLYKITADLDFLGDCHISDIEEGEAERIMHRAKAVNYNSLLPSFRFANHTPKTPEEIQHLYNKQDEQNNNYETDQAFHHGEVTALDRLEQDETLDVVVDKIITHPKFISGSTLKGVIANFHSPRYPCENCEVAILGEQNSEESIFSNKLAQKLKAAGCSLPQFSPIRMLTQISSYKEHNSKSMIGEQQNLEVDMRACNNNLILAKDVGSSNEQVANFRSTKMVL